VEAGAGKRKESEDSKAGEEQMELDDDAGRPPVKRGKEEDDEWANFGSILPTFSNDSKRAQRQKEKEEERKNKGIDKVI